MFDVLPNLLTSIITILFPIFASYKALRTSDPAQLTPWLMYWVVFSCFSLVESWTWFILYWLPFYAYLRLFLLSYLVLPQTQGARLLYQSNIHPFLAHHESEIDSFITHAHDRAKSAGLQYLKRVIDFVKENIFGLQPKAQAQPQQNRQDGSSYAQNLLSRFNLPSAREGLAAPAGDFYGLLSAALGQVGGTGGRKEIHAEDMTSSGTLIPRNITGTAEKMTFLSTQRERLRVLMSALDKEVNALSSEEKTERSVEQRSGEGLAPKETDGLKKSKSETEFDKIEKDEATAEAVDKAGSAGSWMSWAWGSKPNTGTSTSIDS